MPLGPSSLSIACASIAEFVRLGVDAAANSVNVRIGAPTDAAATASEQRINLFFYRFEPSGFESSLRPDEPWRIRLHCLITAFGADEDSILAGEHDLRMLGEVMRIFRETPVMDAVDVNGETVRLQAAFSPLNTEHINQIWSTQGDTSYRPSIAYEIALAPIVPSEPFTGGPVVGSIGAEVRASEDGRHEAFGGTAASPPVIASTVDTRAPDWAPQICFIHNDECLHSLVIEADDAFTPMVWVAGDPSETVSLVWEAWDSSGWSEVGTPVGVNPFTTGIDPDDIPAASPPDFPVELTLPLTLAPEKNAGQALLFATRSYSPLPDDPPREVRSNPLLISIYREPA